MISFVDFAVFLAKFDRVCRGSRELFLVRNWCGPAAVENVDFPSVPGIRGSRSKWPSKAPLDMNWT